MSSRITKTLIVFSAAVSLLLNTGFSFVSPKMNSPTTLTNAQAAFPFKDAKGHQAEAAIAEMYVKGVMSGYEDGTFRPKRPVTFLEATVMLDKLLWGKPIKSDFTSNEYLYEQFGIPNWAVGYIASALRNNILAYNELQKVSLQQPLTREDAAILAVRAMELTNQVKRKQDTPLPFPDSHQISENARGYVVIAWEQKIFSGSSNGKFSPADPISRAEMAIVLSRLVQQNPSLLSDEISGFVKSVNPITTTVSLVYHEDQEAQVKLPEQCLYYLNDRPSSFTELAVGNYVRIITTESAAPTVVISRFVAPDAGSNLTVKSVNLSTVPVDVKQWIEQNQISENYLFKSFDDGLYFLVSRGEKMYSGYTVDITKITTTTDDKGIHYRVWLDKSDPSRTAIKLPVISYPMAVVRIDNPKEQLADVTFVNNINQVVTVITPPSKSDPLK